MNIYKKAYINGCYLESTCVDCTRDEWDKFMHGARNANKVKVIKTALIAGVISEEQASTEIKKKHYNPYQQFITKTHVIYVNSAVEYFIKINK